METGKLIGIAAAAIFALIVGGGGVLWVVRTSVGAMVKQNRTLMETFVDTAKNQVEATNRNTEATQKLAARIDRYIAVGDERNQNMKDQLDRIEHAAIRRRRGDEHA